MPATPMQPLASAGATPAMAQWFAAKEAHPDALLFFRMGDFYELFFADAEAAAAALDIVLSHRGEHNGVPVPMCGVPKHAAEAYLARLIRRGYRVAVAEQMEDPKTRASTKIPIRREIVRLITPGTITEDALLESGLPNLLLALARGQDTVGAAWLDISTGMFETAVLSPADLQALLGRLEPAEIIAPDTLSLGEWTSRRGPETVPSPPLVARRRLADLFQTASLDAFGAFSDVEAVAAMLAVDYVRSTQAGALPRLARPVPMGDAGVMAMDAATRASLEIHRARDGGALHTLLAVVKHTVTPAGARLLGSWLAAPLTDPAAIVARQDAWSWMLANTQATTRVAHRTGCRAGGRPAVAEPRRATRPRRRARHVGGGATFGRCVGRSVARGTDGGPCDPGAGTADPGCFDRGFDRSGTVTSRRRRDDPAWLRWRTGCAPVVARR
jgi:DNA mismatch repair protein MutS